MENHFVVFLVLNVPPDISNWIQLADYKNDLFQGPRVQVVSICSQDVFLEMPIWRTATDDVHLNFI